jgi:hypothetical protein
MESYATGNNGSYPTADAAGLAALVSEGYRATTGVTLAIASSSSTGYCLTVDHANLGASGASIDYKYNSTVGRPQPGNCP